MLLADCKGSSAPAYAIHLYCNQNGFYAGHCTCPVGNDGRCKHIVACLLMWRNKPKEWRAFTADDINAILSQSSPLETIPSFICNTTTNPNPDQQLQFINSTTNDNINSNNNTTTNNDSTTTPSNDVNKTTANINTTTSNCKTISQSSPYASLDLAVIAMLEDINFNLTNLDQPEEMPCNPETEKKKKKM